MKGSKNQTLAPEKSRNSSSNSIGPSSVLALLAGNQTLSKHDLDNFINEEILFCQIENSTIEAGDPVIGSVYFSTPRQGLQNMKIHLTFKGMLHVKTSRGCMSPFRMATYKMNSNLEPPKERNPPNFSIPFVTKTFFIFHFLRKMLPGVLYKVPFAIETSQDLPLSVQTSFNNKFLEEKLLSCEKRYISSMCVVYDLTASISIGNSNILKDSSVQTIFNIRKREYSKNGTTELTFGSPKSVDLDHVFDQYRSISFFDSFLCCQPKKTSPEAHQMDGILPSNGIRNRGLFRLERGENND